MQGFIYVLRNESMPGILKIGKTTRTPGERASELFTTGVPTPFEIVTAIFTKYLDETENDIHNHLAEFRVSGNREFFKISELEAVERVASFCLTENGVSAALDPLIMSSNDAFQWSETCGVDWYEVGAVLKHITPSAWKAAAAAWEEWKSNRYSGRTREASNG